MLHGLGTVNLLIKDRMLGDSTIIPEAKCSLYHDFFLASQHPSISTPHRRLAAKYSMPARMWHHGVHSFLELLRRRLPHSLEHIILSTCLLSSILHILLALLSGGRETSVGRRGCRRWLCTWIVLGGSGSFGVVRGPCTIPNPDPAHHRDMAHPCI